MFTPNAVAWRIRLYILFAVLYCLLSLTSVHAQQNVAVTAVYAGVNSVKVDYQPVGGARDYRIYDVSNPVAVKYAGVWHLDADQLGQFSKLQFAVDSAGNPVYPLATKPTSAYSPYHHLDIPALEIELNGLAPGPHTLIVQAVDALGPCPPANLYDSSNLPAMNAASMNAMGGEGMDTMLGANAGSTSDGMVSTDGQGPTTNKPSVIAQSQPFTVATPGGPPAIPTATATASFFDTFSSGTFAQASPPDLVAGNESFTLTTPAGVWDVFENHCDLRDSRPFIMNNHYMAVDFDGGSPGSNEPLHVAYSAIGISSQATADFSSGQILHCTMEVDAHTDSRRWVGFALVPAGDPLTAFDWEENEAVNKSNTGLWVQFEAGSLLVDELVNGVHTAITGAAGQAQQGGYRTLFQGWQFGRGLDDRSRFDLFVSQSHFAVYEGGIKEAEYDLPIPLPFAQAKVYDVQYLYHSALEQQSVPVFETYWRTLFPTSDERHWSACGWETLPASTAWASVASLIKLPPAQAPVYTVTPPVTDPLQPQVDSLTAQVAADKTQITTLSGQVSTLNGQVNTLQSKIDAVKAALGE
ncbi:MAG TPA: hypothetical protein VFW40_13035 [Capsulimonadaceae bacterium]|nr:hypothetical protein [Capsulimonadaceae bacterium]